MSEVRNISHINISAPVELIRYAVSERNLVNKYETNRFIRAIGTWLILKSETTSGVIQSYSRQLSYLCSITQLSTASFYSRLRFLQREGLVTVEGNNLALSSWETVRQTYFLHNTDKRINFKYDPHGKQQIHYLLSALEIACNQELQSAALQRKLDKNPELKAEQISILQRAGADVARLNDLSYVIASLHHLQLQSFVKFRPGSDIFDSLHKFRADVNRGVKGIAYAWAAKSPSTACYWKKRMQQQEIISVEKHGCITSECRSRKGPENHVIWNTTHQQTVWVIPDQLTVKVPYTKELRKPLPLKVAA